jgi:hypothetical protein
MREPLTWTMVLLRFAAQGKIVQVRAPPPPDAAAVLTASACARARADRMRLITSSRGLTPPPSQRLTVRVCVRACTTHSRACPLLRGGGGTRTHARAQLARSPRSHGATASRDAAETRSGARCRRRRRLARRWALLLRGCRRRRGAHAAHADGEV